MDISIGGQQFTLPEFTLGHLTDLAKILDVPGDGSFASTIDRSVKIAAFATGKSEDEIKALPAVWRELDAAAGQILDWAGIQRAGGAAPAAAG